MYVFLINHSDELIGVGLDSPALLKGVILLVSNSCFKEI